MRLPGYSTPEQQTSNSGSMERVIESVDDGFGIDGIKVLHFSDNDAAVALRIGGRNRLLFEESEYEPTGGIFDEEIEEPPFMTSGTMWTVDPDTGLVGEVSIEFHEGEIQGLVYSLHTFDMDNRDPKVYLEWLVSKYIEIDQKAMQDEFDNPGIVQPHEKAPSLLEESGLATIEYVRTAVGVRY